MTRGFLKTNSFINKKYNYLHKQAETTAESHVKLISLQNQEVLKHPQK